jgi:Cft2 family RNA processing exonuclease
MAGTIILKWFLKEKFEDMRYWIHVTQDWDQWRTLVCKAVKVLVPKNAGNSLTSSATYFKVFHSCTSNSTTIFITSVTYTTL